MSRFPNIKNLVKEINKEKGVKSSIDFLFRERPFFDQYSTVEEVIWNEDLDASPQWKSFEYHFSVVTTAIYRVFHQRNIYLSTQAIQDIFYGALKRYSRKTIVDKVIRAVHKWGLHRHTIVVFPLHSVGILGMGWVAKLKKIKAPYFISPSKDFAILPQSNSLGKTCQAVDLVLKKMNFKYKGNFPKDMFQHYRTTRSAEWIEQNPLLIGKLRFSRIVPYENQYMVRHNIERFTTLAYFVHTMQMIDSPPASKFLGLGSTRVTNNWSTMDLHHYLTIGYKPGKKSIDCESTPINMDQIELSELMALNVEFYPALDRKSRIRAEKLSKTLQKVYGSVEQSRWKHKSDISHAEKFFQKCLDSLAFFRRSFRAATMDEKVVNLATAFESLLLDSYEARSGKIEDVFKNRVFGIYHQKKDHSAAQVSAAMKDLYKARSEVVHSGNRLRNFESLALAQSAYVRVFEALVTDMRKLDFDKQHPIRAYFKAAGYDS